MCSLFVFFTAGREQRCQTGIYKCYCTESVKKIPQAVYHALPNRLLLAKKICAASFKFTFEFAYLALYLGDRLRMQPANCSQPFKTMLA